MLMAFQAIEPGAPRECDFSLCSYGHSPITLIMLQPWRPYVDNPGTASPESGRRCPRPRATTASAAAHLVEAPLPTGYDPYALDERGLVACVRLAPSGDVLAARLLGETGKPGLDPALLATIRSAWRFSSPAPMPERPLWHRVNLSAR
jgi:hypothetical protein